jgi:hypothetical protein
MHPDVGARRASLLQYHEAVPRSVVPVGELGLGVGLAGGGFGVGLGVGFGVALGTGCRTDGEAVGLGIPTANVGAGRGVGLGSPTASGGLTATNAESGTERIGRSSSADERPAMKRAQTMRARMTY